MPGFSPYSVAVCNHSVLICATCAGCKQRDKPTDNAYTFYGYSRMRLPRVHMGIKIWILDCTCRFFAANRRAREKHITPTPYMNTVWNRRVTTHMGGGLP